MPDATLLALGDLHLGRAPSRLPAGLAGRVGPARALHLAVEAALERRVDAVLFAGDVVQNERHFLEAYGPLRREVERLIEAGIAVLGVAGNHDVEALPRLARELEGFVLLGAGGRWESALVRRDGAPVARILGWSFPRPQVRASPLEGWPEDWRAGHYGDDAPDELPTLGLLHADVESSESDYAPVRPSALAEAAPRLDWLLGHVHRPSLVPETRPFLGYLGSVCALHPNETGDHGPWLLELEGRTARLEQLPLSPVHYARVAVDLEPAQDREGVELAVVRAVEDEHRAQVARRPGLGALALELRFEGACGVPEELRRAVAEEVRSRTFGDEGLPVVVHRVRDRTRRAVDLGALAGESTPLGLLAARLLELETDGAEPLLGRLERREAAVLRRPAYVGRIDEADDERLARDARRARLRAVGQRALECLLAQRRPPDVEGRP